MTHPLGPFDLLGVAGRGGMGVVFRAVHREDGVPVAVKLIAGDGIDPDALDAEVEATAALNHPGIVTVYDVGRVPDAAASAELPAGAPYFAMEYLGGGTLQDHGRRMPWLALRNALLAILDALAHAHARGVVHLDLKPANVMRTETGEWRLVDFGISKLAVRPGKVIGTPAYMAPEQLRGDVDAIGPAADLYALGVLGWQMVSGAVPFDGAPSEILSRALAGALPGLQPQRPVPHGLEDWLRRLLAAGIEDRFACAADAAWALARLPMVRGLDGLEMGDVRDVSSTFTLDAVTAAVVPVIDGSPASGGLPQDEHPPIPPRFARPLAPLPPPSNLGLGLFGVRPLPFVGRTAELDALWAELVAVHGGGEARIARIEGPGGIGKTRLARAIAHRAYEVGAATVLEVDPVAADPLRDALRPWRALAPDPGTAEAEAWGAWLEGTRTVAQDVRLGLAAGALKRLGARRPVVIVVDDAERGTVAPALAQLLDGAPIRALLLLTARSDALEPTPAHLRIALAGLALTDLRALLHQSLGVESEVSLGLAREAHGQPRYLANVLAHWVERGRLRPGDGGYRLAPGSDVGAEARAIHAARLSDWLGPAGSPAWQAIGLAATLGQAVRRDEWSAACDAHGVPIPRQELMRGTRLGLVRVGPDTVTFGDTDLREAVLSAFDADSLSTLHRVCATAVNPRHHDRRAAHLEASGQLQEAAEAMWRAAIDANATGDTVRAVRTFERLLGLLDQVGASEEKVADVLGWIAWGAYQLGQFDEATERARQTIAIGERLGSPYLVASGHHTLGVVAVGEGRPDAPALLTAAADGYAAAGNTGLALQARIATMAASPATAENVARLDAIRADQEGMLRGFVDLRRAQLLQRLGRLPEALAAVDAAARQFVAEGLPERAAAGDLIRADVLLAMGDLSGADETLHRAMHTIVVEGTFRRSIELQRGLVLLRLRRFAEAAFLVRRHLRFYRQMRWAEPIVGGLFGMMVVCAWDGEGEAFDAAAVEAEDRLAQLYRPPDQDMTDLVEIAAELWEEQGDEARAGAARALAARIRR